MRTTLEALNRMEADGIIARYAIAVAAYNYIEAAVTEDLDILVDLRGGDLGHAGLVTLAPILSYLASKGYTEFRKEGLLIEGWPVQFLPVADALDAEALAAAAEIDIDIPNEGSVRARILTPEYLVAIALRVGQPKDLIRVSQFLDEGGLDLSLLRDLLRRHWLTGAWTALLKQTATPDPFSTSSPK